MYIYLDDERNPKTDHPWHVVRSVEEFKACLDEWNDSTALTISFDHDLGSADHDTTGFAAMKYLCIYLSNQVAPWFLKNVEINVHSANPIGRDNIMNYWKSFYKFKTGEEYVE